MLLAFCEVYDPQGLCRLRHCNRPETRDRISENQSERKRPRLGVTSLFAKPLGGLCSVRGRRKGARPRTRAGPLSQGAPARGHSARALGPRLGPRGLAASLGHLQVFGFLGLEFYVFRFFRFRVQGSRFMDQGLGLRVQGGCFAMLLRGECERIHPSLQFCSDKSLSSCF